MNAPRLFILIFNLLKPFISDHVAKSIIFHNDNTSLHKHISPDILPSDFGGRAGPFDNSLCYEAIMKMEDFFEELKNIEYDKWSKPFIHIKK